VHDDFLLQQLVHMITAYRQYHFKITTISIIDCNLVLEGIPAIVFALSVDALLALATTGATAAVLAASLYATAAASNAACGTRAAGHRAAMNSVPAAPHCAALLSSSVYSN
jgi:hypothetical protein